MLGAAARTLNNIAKVYSPATRILLIAVSLYGVTSVMMYIRREGMPLPPFDVGLIPLAMLASIVFFVVISIVFLMFILPTFPAFIASGQFARRFHAMIQGGERLSVRRAINDYLWVYAPYLGLCASIPFVAARNSDTAITYIFVLSGIALSCLECWWREGNLKNTLIMIGCVLLANLAAAFWLTTIATSIALPLLEEKFSAVDVSDDIALLIMAVIAALSASIHFVLAISGKNVPFVIFLFVVYLFGACHWPGASYLGGKTLSALGYGGRLPATIEVASSQRAGPAKTLSGCIILNTSSIMYFMETTNKDDCKVINTDKYNKFLSRMAIYKRDDVVKIYEFPTTSATSERMTQ